MPNFHISDLRGGRNGIDNVTDPRFPMIQCAEAQNVDFFSCPIGGKRGGADALSLAGGTAITGAVKSLIRHVPAGNEGDAEFWLQDSAATPLVKRLAGGVTWADIAFADAIASGYLKGVSFNGKLFLFYDSIVDYLHCWDGTSVRRVGFVAPGAAPTVANTGAGAYAAVQRWYRVRWLRIVGGLINARSEPSPTVAFTPSGAGSAARVTQPAIVTGWSPTHWEIEGSASATGPFYQIFGFEQGNHIAIATTTGDDSVTVSAYSSRALSAAVGTYHAPTSFRFAVTDGNRLVMAGANESGGKTSRVSWTNVLGSTNKGDDERIPNFATLVNYLDINERDGGEITGMGGPINGTIWVFKYRQIWRFTPTGEIDVPYLARKISDVVGAIDDRSIILAEDALGNPALYFWATKGPHRLSVNGLEYLGRDIEDYTRGIKEKEKVNLSATTVAVHGRYHADKSQIWWWASTGVNNIPNVKFTLDIKQAIMQDRFGIRGGWQVHTGGSAAAYCSEMFGNTVGANMSRDLKPYIGTATKILKCDSDDSNTDDGVAYQAYIKTRSLIPSEKLGTRFSVGETLLFAEGTVGATIRQTIIRNFGERESTNDVVLTPEGNEPEHVVRMFKGSAMQDCAVVQIQLGDSAAVDSDWDLDELVVPLYEEGPIVGTSS